MYHRIYSVIRSSSCFVSHHFTSTLNYPFKDDPKSPSLKYTWQNVGVIDFDSDRRLWLVQKLTPEERVLDENGNPIINKAFRPDGI